MGYATLAAQGNFDPATGLVTFTNQPPDTQGLVRFDDAGKRLPVWEARGAASTTPGPGTTFAEGPGITFVALSSTTTVISALARPGTGNGSLVVDNHTNSTATGVNATAIGGAGSEASGENSVVVNCYDTQVDGLNCAAYNCQNCIVDADCVDVTLINCQGLIVPNRQNATYLDNVEVVPGPTTTDDLPEGGNNLYYTFQRMWDEVSFFLTPDYTLEHELTGPYVAFNPAPYYMPRLSRLTLLEDAPTPFKVQLPNQGFQGDQGTLVQIRYTPPSGPAGAVQTVDFGTARIKTETGIVSKLTFEPGQWVHIARGPAAQGTTNDDFHVTLRGSAYTGSASAVGSGSVLKFDRGYEYPPIASGTFTVDTTGAQPGVAVRVRLEATATAPTLPVGFTLWGGSHQPNKANLYCFCVEADGTIDYYISSK